LGSGTQPSLVNCPETLDDALRDALAEMSLKDAAKTVSEALGLPRKQVYERALALK